MGLFSQFSFTIHTWTSRFRKAGHLQASAPLPSTTSGSLCPPWNENAEACSHLGARSPGLTRPHGTPVGDALPGTSESLPHSPPTVLSCPSPALITQIIGLPDLLLPGCHALLNKCMPLFAERSDHALTYYGKS